MDFNGFFKQYEALVQQADALFTRVKQDHHDAVRCQEKCADCCHALFDLTLVEALYIKAQFDARYVEQARADLIERANAADREIYRLKRQAFKEHEEGRPEDQILEEMARQRVRCPALNAEDRCEIYAFRPITCRIYGIPTVIGGRAHTCGLSAFNPGEKYPTVKMDAIYQRLYEISLDLAKAIESRFPGLPEMLVPLSMALLTDYTEDYLGVRKSADTEAEASGEKE
jgi:Fe-S-cluster containining protein